MKKFLLLFVVVAFVALMAAGALAEETDCVPNPCPDCSDEAELPVDVTIRGVSCIWICQDRIPHVETVIPCDPGICWGDPADFAWKAWATGDYPRHIVGWTKLAYATRFDVHFMVNFGDPYGVGWVTLPETEGAVVAEDLMEMCDETWRIGEVKVGAGEGAPAVCNARAYLKFRIIDNFCESDAAISAFTF